MATGVVIGYEVNRQKPPTQGHGGSATCAATSQVHLRGPGADSRPRRFLHHALHPLSLELHHWEILPSSFWIKGSGDGVLHWSGRGRSGEIWGSWRCKGCSRGCGRYRKSSWLSLAQMCVYVCVSSGHCSRHPRYTREQHGTQSGGWGHHHQGAYSQVSVLPPRAWVLMTTLTFPFNVTFYTALFIFSRVSVFPAHTMPDCFPSCLSAQGWCLLNVRVVTVYLILLLLELCIREFKTP